jgi:hypothetical protein
MAILALTILVTSRTVHAPFALSKVLNRSIVSDISQPTVIDSQPVLSTEKQRYLVKYRSLLLWQKGMHDHDGASATASGSAEPRHRV